MVNILTMFFIILINEHNQPFNYSATIDCTQDLAVGGGGGGVCIDLIEDEEEMRCQERVL